MTQNVYNDLTNKTMELLLTEINNTCLEFRNKYINNQTNNNEEYFEGIKTIIQKLEEIFHLDKLPQAQDQDQDQDSDKYNEKINMVNNNNNNNNNNKNKNKQEKEIIKKLKKIYENQCNIITHLVSLENGQKNLSNKINLLKINEQDFKSNFAHNLSSHFNPLNGDGSLHNGGQNLFDIKWN